MEENKEKIVLSKDEQDKKEDEKKKRCKMTPILWIFGILLLLFIGFLVREYTKSDRIDFEQKRDQALSELTPEELAELYEKYQEWDGTWTGFWQNTDTGNAGEATGVVDVQPDGIVTVTVDVDGAVFGLVDPSETVYIGYYDMQGAHFFTEDDEVFGTVSLDAQVDGRNFFARATDLPFREEVTGSGSWTEDGELTISYTIDFFTDRVTHGIVNMSKVE